MSDVLLTVLALQDRHLLLSIKAFFELLPYIHVSNFAVPRPCKAPRKLGLTRLIREYTFNPWIFSKLSSSFLTIIYLSCLFLVDSETPEVDAQPLRKKNEEGLDDCGLLAEEPSSFKRFSGID